MNQSKRITRQKRISDLINSFSLQKTSSQKSTYVIDRSFHCVGVKQIGLAQKEILNKTIDSFVKHEKRQLDRLQKAREKTAENSSRRKILKSVQKLQQSKSLHLFTPQPKKVKHINLSLSTKHIYIERKYNSQIAYQMHTVLQAKRIQDERNKFMKQQSHQASPLLHDMLKKVRYERASAGANQNRHFPANSISIHQQYDDEKLARAISKYIHNEKEAQWNKQAHPKPPGHFSPMVICKNQSKNYIKRGIKVQ